MPAAPSCQPRCRTKIVATLGPASGELETIRGMIQAGMAVARINLSHGTPAENAQRIAACRQAASALGTQVGIIADLQGPKLRIGEFAGGAVDLRQGQEFRFTSQPSLGDGTHVYVQHPQVLAAMTSGSRVLLGDGEIELVVEANQGDEVLCRVLSGGSLVSHKGITVPGVHIELPALTDKDKADLAFALDQHVDYVALSFVQHASDVEELRTLIRQAGHETPIIAKIERKSAIDCFDELLASADAIMVARGDLGLEVPAEDVPIYQKTLIARARAASRPVITATQMLESMITNPRPTRAEASDVANAILDGTDAVMLSGETATGRYPVEAVQMMQRIARVTEENLPYDAWLRESAAHVAHSVTEGISEAGCELAAELGAAAIIAATMSGLTARMLAKNRPRQPIIAVTPDPDLIGRLTLVWGVIPLLVPAYTSTDLMSAGSIEAARQKGLVGPDDLVVLTAGVPIGGAGRTNMIRVHRTSEAFPVA